jgi:hypothetical protein
LPSCQMLRILMPYFRHPSASVRAYNVVGLRSRETVVSPWW